MGCVVYLYGVELERAHSGTQWWETPVASGPVSPCASMNGLVFSVEDIRLSYDYKYGKSFSVWISLVIVIGSILYRLNAVFPTSSLTSVLKTVNATSATTKQIPFNIYALNCTLKTVYSDVTQNYAVFMTPEQNFFIRPQAAPIIELAVRLTLVAIGIALMHHIIT